MLAKYNLVITAFIVIKIWIMYTKTYFGIWFIGESEEELKGDFLPKTQGRRVKVENKGQKKAG